MPWDINMINSEIVAIHVALLPPYQILLFGGDEANPDQLENHQIDHTRIFDIRTSTIAPMSSPTTDVFCAGHTCSADGNVIVAGGTETWLGTAHEHGHGAMLAHERGEI